MARATKLTSKLQAAIVERVQAGNFPEVAAQCEGVSSTAFYEWMQRGRSGEEPFAEFAESITRARAEAEAKALREVREAHSNFKRLFRFASLAT